MNEQVSAMLTVLESAAKIDVVNKSVSATVSEVMSAVISEEVSMVATTAVKAVVGKTFSAEKIAMPL